MLTAFCREVVPEVTNVWFRFDLDVRDSSNLSLFLCHLHANLDFGVEHFNERASICCYCSGLGTELLVLKKRV